MFIKHLPKLPLKEKVLDLSISIDDTNKDRVTEVEKK
jgi:hypothetical protein